MWRTPPWRSLLCPRTPAWCSVCCAPPHCSHPLACLSAAAGGGRAAEAAGGLVRPAERVARRCLPAAACIMQPAESCVYQPYQTHTHFCKIPHRRILQTQWKESFCVDHGWDFPVPQSESKGSAHLGRLGGGPMTGRSWAACCPELFAPGPDGCGGGGGATSLGRSAFCAAPATMCAS